MAVINVPFNYCGANTNGKAIVKGEYKADDPALFGLASYLVEHGHAKLVSGSLDELPDSPAEPEPEQDDSKKTTSRRKKSSTKKDAGDDESLTEA